MRETLFDVVIFHLSELITTSLVDTILSASICWNEHWKKNCPVSGIRGDILVIPQASLVGKMKGKNIQ